MCFERLKLLAKDEFGCDISRTKKKSSFEELFGFKLDPESVKKLHDSRANIPLYFEPFERLQSESEGED